MIYRYKVLLEFLYNSKLFVSPFEIAKGIGMSWNTASKDLNYLVKLGYVEKIPYGKERFRYRFKMSNSLS